MHCFLVSRDYLENDEFSTVYSLPKYLITCEVSLRPCAFPSSLHRGCGVVDENVKKLQTFGDG